MCANHTKLETLNKHFKGYVMSKTKYTFYPDSVKGLEHFVSTFAVTFKEAEEKIIKWIYLGTTGNHEIIDDTIKIGVYSECIDKE